MKIIKTPLGIFNYRKYRLWHSRALVPFLVFLLLLSIAFDLGRLSVASKAKEAIKECNIALERKPQVFCNIKPRNVLGHKDSIRVRTPGFDAYCIEVENLR